MFEKTLLEELKEASISNEEAYVSYFNTGDIRKDDRIVTERMNGFYQNDFINTIKFLFRDAAEYYARESTFDFIKMNLELGLVYNKEDIDEENKVKENAEPIKDVVRCYTSGITSYLNGEKANKLNYQFDRKGFLNYNDFISKMKKDGISFEGPKTFDEFKNSILSGEIFDVSIFANLKEKDKMIEVQEPVNETKVEETESVVVSKKEEPKKLVKFPFFKRK